MKISVIGAGYVGLSSAACLFVLKNKLTVIDLPKKIESINHNITDIYEEGLDDIFLEAKSSNGLSFYTDYKYICDSELVIVAVGTPFNSETGETNLSYIFNAISSIVEAIKKDNTYKLIVIRSTVPIGTTRKINDIIKNTSVNAEVVFIPEFVREGSIIYDFFNPARIIIGSEQEVLSPNAMKILNESHSYFIEKEIPIIYTSWEEAECIKYASNSFLGVKISYINQVADLCNKIGANIDTVAKGIGLDPRIGKHFLKAGPGFGGSCFPKDMQEILAFSKQNDCDLSIIKEAFDYNTSRIKRLATNIYEQVKNYKTVGVLGLAYKGGTNDTRYSPALVIVKELLNHNVNVLAYDPQAMSNAQKEINSNTIKYAENIDEICKNADILVVLTEWQDFIDIDFHKYINTISSKTIIDLRNILNKKQLQDIGFEYKGV